MDLLECCEQPVWVQVVAWRRRRLLFQNLIRLPDKRCRHRLESEGDNRDFKIYGRFVLLAGEVEYVDCLPKEYNGDVIFSELPPVDSLAKRGSGLGYMDRENDCYRWTRLISTSTNIVPKDL